MKVRSASEEISGSCDCLYFFWVCEASVVSTETTRRIKNDAANAAVRHGGENESRILGSIACRRRKATCLLGPQDSAVCTEGQANNELLGSFSILAVFLAAFSAS
jgi:hypothetical protein